MTESALPYQLTYTGTPLTLEDAIAVGKAILDVQRNINAKKADLEKETRRHPPPQKTTRYFMAKALPAKPRLLAGGEEVTEWAAVWHKAGTLLTLIQRGCVIAWPPVNPWVLGEPPAVPEPLAHPPTVKDLIASGSPPALAEKLANLEFDAFVRRLEPYGPGSREGWVKANGAQLEAIKLEMEAPPPKQEPVKHVEVPGFLADAIRRAKAGEDPQPRDWRALPPPTTKTEWVALRKRRLPTGQVAEPGKPIHEGVVAFWREEKLLPTMVKEGFVIPVPLANPYASPVDHPPEAPPADVAGETKEPAPKPQAESKKLSDEIARELASLDEESTNKAIEVALVKAGAALPAKKSKSILLGLRDAILGSAEKK